MSFKTVLIGGLLTAAVGASAQLISVGPFTGLHSEGFESFPNYDNGGIYDTLSIMQGTATLSDVVAGTDELNIYSPTTAPFGLGANGLATVNSGLNAIGLWSDQNAVDVTLTFNHAVGEFGGYFDDNTDYPSGLTFWDSNGNQISGVQSVNHLGNAMDWYGWSSVDLIKSVTFTAAPVDGVVVMDDLQATPEPGSFAVLGLGALGLLIRRKKR